MNIDFKLGSVIKQIRQDKGYSQTELCKGICHPNTLLKIESNKQSPSFEILNALAIRMGIRTELLIKYGEVESNAYYIQQKIRMEEYMGTLNFVDLEIIYRTIDKKLYNSLDIIEQQYLDFVQAVILLHVYNDLENAYILVKNALAKTYKNNANFFSPEECKLINFLLRLDQSDKNIELAKTAFTWTNRQDKYLRDIYSSTLLITGLTMTSFIKENWIELLEHATIGEKIAHKFDKARFVPNFVFMQGLANYMLQVNQEFGIAEMKRALSQALLIKLPEHYNELLSYARKYNIKLNLHID